MPYSDMVVCRLISSNIRTQVADPILDDDNSFNKSVFNVIFIRPHTSLTHGHFYYRDQAQIDTLAQPSEKILYPIGIPRFGAPQATSNKHSPAKQILPVRKDFWDQTIQLDNTDLTRTPGATPTPGKSGRGNSIFYVYVCVIKINLWCAVFAYNSLVSWLVGFYGISTLELYLMPYLLYSYIIYIWFVKNSL